MKLSDNTIKVLENFARVNNSILFLKGKEQTTMTPSKSFLATATLEEEIPKEFGIYKLSQFLQILSLFNDPDIEFEDDQLTISEADTKVVYVYCSPSVIISPPKGKKITVADPLFSFDLTEDRLTKLLQSAKVIGLPNFIIEANSGDISICLHNVDNSRSKDSYSISIPKDIEAEDGKAVLDVADLILIPDDYTVTVSSKIVHFKGKNKNIEYFAVAQA